MTRKAVPMVLQRDIDFSGCSSASFRFYSNQASFFLLCRLNPSISTFREEKLPHTHRNEGCGIWKKKNHLGSPGGQDINTQLLPMMEEGTGNRSRTLLQSQLGYNFTQGCRLKNPVHR